MIELKNAGQFRMELTNGALSLTTDAPAAHGGRGEYPTPVELMADALAACALTTASMAAAKAGLNPDGWRAEVTGIQFAEGHGKVTAIAIAFHFAKDVDPSMRRRLEAFTHNGCTVGNTLTAEKQFTFSYDL